MSRSLFALGLVLALVSLGGCAGGSMTCRVGADCPSRVCMTDGTCATTRDAGAVDAPLTPSDASEPDAWVETEDTGVVVDGGSLVCAPNHDGIVSRAEVPLRAGLRANFRIAQNTTVSTAGTTSGGARTWDYSGSYTGDHDELVELLAPGGNWWAAEFPAATHAARVAAGSDNLGVFQITDDALLLLGVVSPAAGLTQTLLRYDPPVRVLAFPLASGNTFTTTSAVSGQALGIIASYTEEYTSVVDAAGTLITPFGATDALRVRTEMTRTSGFVTLTSQRQFTFVAECFGIAAIVVSGALETQVEFTTATEIRRLAP